MPVRSRPRRPPALDVALAATLHDSTGALAGATRRAVPMLRSLYRHVAVTTSPTTAEPVRRVLAAAGMHAGAPAANRRGPLYRLAVRRARATGAARVHYLDFDRALHWIARKPRELGAALRASTRHDVLLLGRTPAAHRSHHLPLHATEVVANRVMAERAGLGRPLDLLVPSFVMTRSLAGRLLAASRARDTGVYGEWAALLLGLRSELAYLECAGLDWETPDRHARAIRRHGLAAWRRRLETPAEWALRVEMAATIVATFESALAARTPAVRRLARRAG